MLSLSTLINHLNTKQAAWVEKRLFSELSINRPSLSLFKGIRSGKSLKEIQDSLELNGDQFAIVSRPIYNSILELYGLSASSAKDALLSEVFYSLYKKSYANTADQISTLERLFHEMKKHQIEQNSSKLLERIYQLHIGSPLQAVYQHLYIKYKKVEEINTQAIQHFEDLNQNLGLYFQDPGNTELVREMIYSYKLIRTLYAQAENKTLEAFLKLSQLILVELCGQEQLLKERQVSKKDLVFECTKLIEALPFGVCRFFLKNILQSVTSNSNCAAEKDNALDSIHNFYFKLLHQPEKETVNAFSFPETIEILASSINDARKKLIRQTVSSFSIPRDSWSTSSTKLIG